MGSPWTNRVEASSPRPSPPQVCGGEGEEARAGTRKMRPLPAEDRVTARQSRPTDFEGGCRSLSRSDAKGQMGRSEGIQGRRAQSHGTLSRSVAILTGWTARWAVRAQMPPSTYQRRVVASRLRDRFHFLVSPFLSLIS